MSGPEALDPAAEAFDHLRSEVMLLRRAIEGLAASQPEAPPDYAPTLAHLVKLTGSMGELLRVLAESPYLASSPADLEAEIETVIRRTRQVAQAELRQVIDGLGRATAEVTLAAGQVRSRDRQRRWLAYAAAGGGSVALVLWLVLSGPIARALPVSWQAPERMAAATIGESRWHAGVRMMRGAEPEAWRWLALGDGLVRRNRSAVQACVSKADKAGRPVGCVLLVDPPVR